MRIVTWKYFYEVGLKQIGMSPDSSFQQKDRFFRAHFGTSWEICGAIWLSLVTFWNSYEYSGEGGELVMIKPLHLLWALSFLKNYETDDKSAKFWKKAVKTYRKWTHLLLDELEFLSIEKVRL